MTTRFAAWFATFGVAIAAALVGCGGGTGSGSSADWALPNGDLSNTRVASSDIDSSNIDQLGVAWRMPLTAGGTFGYLASTSLVHEGTLYMQDLASNVHAINLETGEELWKRSYDEKSIGPNGL